jgi:glycosyltransferase involved in cell wall biosynthesis
VKVLVSAYACEPDKGSEPGVGWHWAIEIARLGHVVHVITRANNRVAIAAAIAAGRVPDNLHFHYCDLGPRWIRLTKTWLRSPYLYYYFWQRRAVALAKMLHAEIGFDMVHHLTFGSVRLPSMMGQLGIPFWFGPLGGGETAPRQLRKHFPLRGRIADGLRDVSNGLIRFDPLMRRSFAAAERILLKTPDSLWCVPRKYRHKCAAVLEIGIDAEAARRPAKPAGEHKRVLFVGRHLYWKGMGLGLRAFARTLEREPDLRLTMVGGGEEKRRWQGLARNLGIEHQVDWPGWLDRADVSEAYASHDLFLFPSLHDSSGNVILEATLNGLPVVCFDLGGPGMIVDETIGLRVSAQGSEDEAIAGLAEAMLHMLAAPPERDTLVEWAAQRTWGSAVAELYLRSSQGEA